MRLISRINLGKFNTFNQDPQFFPFIPAHLDKIFNHVNGFQMHVGTGCPAANLGQVPGVASTYIYSRS